METEQISPEANILIELLSMPIYIIVRDAMMVLDILENNDYVGELSAHIYGDQIDTRSFKGEVTVMFDKHISSVANVLGIHFTEDTPLSIKVTVMKFMTSVKYVDITIREHMSEAIVSSSEDSASKLISAMSELVTYTDEEMHDAIDVVDDGLIDLLLDILTHKSESEFTTDDNDVAFLYHKNRVFINIKEYSRNLPVEAISYFKMISNYKSPAFIMSIVGHTFSKNSTPIDVIISLTYLVINFSIGGDNPQNIFKEHIAPVIREMAAHETSVLEEAMDKLNVRVK